jgi:hypothetical protein
MLLSQSTSLIDEIDRALPQVDFPHGTKYTWMVP